MTCYDLIDVDQRVALLKAMTAGQTLVMVSSYDAALGAAPFRSMAEHPTLNVIMRTEDGYTQYFEVDGTRRVYHIQDYRVGVIERRREVEYLSDSGKWMPDGGWRMSQVVVLDPHAPPTIYGYAAEHPKVGRLEEYQ